MFPRVFLQFFKIYAKKRRLKLFFLTALAFVAGIMEFCGIALIFPFMLLLTSSDVQIPQRIFELTHIQDKNVFLGFFGACIIGVFILKNIFMIIFTRFQSNVMCELSNDIYTKVMKNFLFSPFVVSDSLTLGEKFSIFNTAISFSVDAFFHKCIHLFINLCVAAIVLFYLFFEFTVPAIILVTLLGAFAVIQSIFFKRLAKRYGAIRLDAEKGLFDSLNTIIRSIKEIKVLGKENFFFENFLSCVKKLNDVKVLSISASAYPVFVTEISVLLVVAVLGCCIFYLSSSNTAYLISSLAVIFATVLRLLPVLNRVQNALFLINTNKIYASWLIELDATFGKEPEIISEQGVEKLPFETDIVLQDVCFSYKDKRALKDVNLTIKKGEFVGIVGHSGCGKSTMFNLLTGILSPSSGKILIDAVPLTKQNTRAWQKNISLTPQEFYLSPESIVHNVAFGVENDKIDHLKVQEILNRVLLFEKPTEHSLELSAGQKHRVAIAQALYSDNDFLMLDEATSSLDVESESKISEIISSLKGKKTIFAIAHRLTTLKACDKVVFMKEGVIIDIGTFEELASRQSDFEHILRFSNL